MKSITSNEKQQPFGGLTGKDYIILIIDKYLCNLITNPIIITSLILLIYIYLQYNQLMIITILSNPKETYSWDFIMSEDYYYDIISNLINIIIILRFQIIIELSIYIECLLFILQNIMCSLILNHLQYIDNILIKTCIILEIMAPYLVFIISIIDWKTNKDEREDKDNEEEESNGWYQGLRDCNNYFLPLFINYSLLLINYDFPILNGVDNDLFFGYLQFTYKLLSFMFKLYLSYQFILYEYVVIFYNLYNIKDYSIFYKEVSIYNNSCKSIIKNIDNIDFRNYWMLIVCGSLIIFDSIVIYMKP